MSLNLSSSAKAVASASRKGAPPAIDQSAQAECGRFWQEAFRRQTVGKAAKARDVSRREPDRIRRALALAPAQ